MAITVPYSKLALESYLDWVEIPLVVTDETPGDLIVVQPFAEGKPKGAPRPVRSAGPVRIPRALFTSYLSLVGVKSDETQAYIALNVDLNNDVEVTLIATDGIGGGTVSDLGIHARIAGTVQIDGSGSARDVIVISDAEAGRQVLGGGRSAGDGSFDIDFHGYAGPVIALALDQYGQDFETEALYNESEIVHPSTPNGYVFEVTAAGTTGTEEPEWNTDGSTQSGSVTFNSRPFYRPIASGPLLPEKLGDSDPPAPWVHASTHYMASQSRERAVTTIPDCRPGDYLVAYGMRRESITTPQGWTALPDPPDGSYAQWTYMFYKLADGTEAGSVFEVNGSSRNRLTAQVSVIRCPDGYSLTPHHLDSQRMPEGAAASFPLEVTNIDQRSLVIGATSWVYAIGVSQGWSEAFISHPTAQQLAINNKFWQDTADIEDEIRNVGLSVEADPLEVISIGLSITDVDTSADSRSDIWLAFTTDP